MEPRGMAASRNLRAQGASLRPLCRNFARGSCRWGQSCHFSHDRNSVQICRYFQRGFCCYGEQCSYQHVQEEPVPIGTRDGMVPTTRPHRRGPEPSTVPTAMAQGWVGAQHTLACPAPSVTHTAFKFLNMEAEVEEKDKNIPAPGNIPCGANGGESVPTRPQSASGSQLQGLALDPDSSNPRQTVVETVTWTDPAEVPVELGAVAALVPTEVLRARSEAVVCGICMETVYEKPLPQDRRFGILPNCSHPYCVRCIRKWRRSQGFQNTVVKACPECRITSNYYIPHKYWISDVDEKENLIRSFKAQKGKIRCKFFVQNHGQCPFGSDCIYLHKLPTDQQEFSSSSSEISLEEDEKDCLHEWAFDLPEMEMECEYLSSAHDMLLIDFYDSD